LLLERSGQSAENSVALLVRRMPALAKRRQKVEAVVDRRAGVARCGRVVYATSTAAEIGPMYRRADRALALSIRE
jgi:hypothetical protein